MAAAHSLKRGSRDEQRELIEQVARTPQSATVKGMFIEAYLKTFDWAHLPRPTQKRFIPFVDYNLREWMATMIESIDQVYPEKSLREGLELQGELAFSTLRNSSVGRVIFAIAGRDWPSTLRLCPKAYELSLSPAQASVVEIKEQSAIVSLRDVWNFPCCYQVGVFRGGMKSLGLEGTVQVRPLVRNCDVDLLISWK